MPKFNLLDFTIELTTIVPIKTSFSAFKFVFTYHFLINFKLIDLPAIIIVTTSIVIITYHFTMIFMLIKFVIRDRDPIIFMLFIMLTVNFGYQFISIDRPFIIS